MRIGAIWLLEFIAYGLLDSRLGALNDWTARCLGWTLGQCGLAAQVSGNRVRWLGDTGFVIIDECTGIFGLALLVAFMLGVPASAAKRAWGLAGAAAAVFLLNQLRLLLLALVLTYLPSGFDLVHDYLWQVAFLLAVAGLYIAWLTVVQRDRTARLPA